jgi:hypothetical protein
MASWSGIEKGVLGYLGTGFRIAEIETGMLRDMRPGST